VLIWTDEFRRMVKSVEKQRAYDVRTEADSSDVDDRTSTDEMPSRSSSRTDSDDVSSHDQDGYVDSQRDALKEEPVVVNQVIENSPTATDTGDGKHQNEEYVVVRYVRNIIIRTAQIND